MPLDTMTLAVAGIAALAIIVPTAGFAMPGRSGISDRPDPSTPGPPAGTRPPAAGPAGVRPAYPRTCGAWSLRLHGSVAGR